MFNFLKKSDDSKVIEPLDENDSLTEFSVECPIIKELADNKNLIAPKNLDCFMNQTISKMAITRTNDCVKLYFSEGIVELAEDKTWEFFPYKNHV